MQCTEAPPPLEDDVRAGVAKGIQRLVFQLLEKEPDKRPTDASEVVDRLEDFLPERAFGDLTEPSTKLRASPSKRSSKPATSSGPRTDTLPSAPDTPVSGGEASDAVHARRESRAGKRDRKSSPGKIVGRKDTVALIDEASSTRELSTGVSLTIIAVLMVLAGLATYMWRASQATTSDDGAPTTETQNTSDEDGKDEAGKDAASGESSGW
jgi:hypothetical protein